MVSDSLNMALGMNAWAASYHNTRGRARQAARVHLRDKARIFLDNKFDSLARERNKCALENNLNGSATQKIVKKRLQKGNLLPRLF